MFALTFTKIAVVKLVKYNPISYISRKMSGLDLKTVVQRLEVFAPLKLAESWDNVGLLIEPSGPKIVKNIFLTNDLTEDVLREAIDSHADLVISYHPPIFAPLKRITQNNWKERLVVTCLENKIALYSPHTTWDAINNGVNDWLASSLPIGSSLPILINENDEKTGMGRLITLSENISLKDAITKVKQKTLVRTVQVAIGINSSLEKTIRTVAVCAGSGASVLKNVIADLYLTGELSHHEALDAVQNNISVILCNHSNSERGYLKEFKHTLAGLLDGSCKVIVAQNDHDPLSAY